MFRFKKTLAFLTLVVMLISSIPAFSLTAFAKAEEFDGKIELDYDALFDSENTYIVWPSGSTSATNWTFAFRGKTVSVKYSSTKCFTSFEQAYSRFTKKGANIVNLTPVFVLIGNVSVSTTMYSNAIILGANAGISPNAQMDMAQKQANDPEGYWEKGTRYTETVVSGTFTLGNKSTYDKGALNNGVKQYNIIIDGIRLSEATAPLYKSTHEVNANSTEKTINVYVKNSILDFNSAYVCAINCTDDTYNRHNVSFTDVRMATERGINTQTVQKALFDNVPAHVYIDGMFYESSKPIISNINVAGVKEGYTFEVRNSYFKDPGATNSSRLFRIGLSKGKNHIIFDNNIFNRTVYQWGIITFQSSEDYNYTTQTVDFTHNTVISDLAETSTEKTPVYLNDTLFEGGSHLPGPYTLNLLYNRIIGFKTMLPTMTAGAASNQNYSVKGMVAYNYFAPTLTSVNDEKGVAPCYFGSQIDHYKFNSLWYTSDSNKTQYDSSFYYTDYKMTKSSDMFDVMETDFYDDLDTISIDNKNRIIRFKVAEGATISGVSKDYGFRFRSNPTSVTYSKTSFTAAASESTMTVNIGGSTVKYTIITEAQVTTPVSYTQLALDYPDVFEADRLYLYSPSGAKTVVWNGVTYDFTGRTYTTISSLESAATSLMGLVKIKPQIIIPAGTYEAISLSRAAEIYGECWTSPATMDGGLDSTTAGDDWKKSQLTVIKGITLNSGVSQSGSTNNVEISGIVLQGDLKDASRGSYPITLSLKNSVVNGSVVLSSSNNNSDTNNTFTAEGVKINSVGSTGSFITGTAAPATITIKNSEFASGIITTSVFDGWASGLSSKTLALNVTGCRFNGIDASIFGNITKGVAMSNATVNFTGNTVTAARGIRTYGSMLAFDASKIKSLNIEDNWFVNSGAGYYSVMADTSGSITFDNNRLIGVEMGNIGDLKANNYYAPYSLDADEVANGKPYGSTYFLDPALKLKNTEFTVSSVTGGENVTIDNVNRTIHMTGATNPVFNMTSGAEYEIYADSICTVPATISANGRYFMKVKFKGATLVYNVLVSPATDIDYKTTFTDNTFTSDALFVTSDIETADYGTRFTTKWNGRDYSFVAGIDAFANVADAVNSAKNAGKANPTILLGNYGGILSIPVAAKIYTANHSTVPYVKTADADYDWDYNTAYNANKTSVSVIQIGPDATGSVYIGGVELTGYYLDIRRAETSKLNVTLENTLVNKTDADTRCLFDLNGNNAKYASNSETFTVKNCYVKSASKTRLLYEFYPANVIFDGLYVDGNTFDIYNVNYIKNSGKTTSIVFRNSNLRNFTPVGTSYDFLFQGDDTVIESGETKKLIIEDSIIYKFSMAKNGIIPVQTGKYSDIVIDNNVVIASAANTNLIYQERNADNTVGVKVSITDNLLLGVNPAISLGTTALDTANSVVKGNHTTSVVSTEKSGTAITVTGASTITESDFALDNSFDPMYKSGFAVSSVTSDSDAVFDSTINGTSITLSLISGYTLDEVDFGFASDKVTGKVYTTSACTTAATLGSITSGTYYLRGEYTADDAKTWSGDVYTVNVSVADAKYPHFNDDIIADDAILVDSKVDTSGKYYDTEWSGKMYSFVVGKNVFATLDQAIAAAGANPSFLIKDIGGVSGETEVNTFIPTTPGKYYTQNYNKAPYIASDRNLDPDGSEWTANINTGLDNSFNTKDGIEVKCFILNKCKAGDYEFHGFTITNCIQDDTANSYGTRSSDNDINVLFNNTYVEKNYSSAGFFNTGTHFKTTADDATLYNDNITVKNTYYVNNSTVDWFNGDINLWTNLTIDGMFADYADRNITIEPRYIGWYGKEYRFTIKNSNLRNLAPSSNYIHFEGHNSYGVDYHQNTYPQSPKSRSIILEDNIFYNFTFFNKNSAFIYYKQTYYNYFVVKNNYIYAPNDNLNLATGKGGDDVHPEPYVTITDNVFMGINPYYDIDRLVTWHEVFVKDNYCVASRPASTDTVSFGGVKFVLDCNNYRTENGVNIYDYQTDGHYWLDSAKTLSANVIQDMTLSGKPFNTNAQVCDMLVPYAVSVVNLNDYLYNPHNKVTVYADSNFTQVIEDVTALEYQEGKLLYLTVESNDGKGAVETRMISMARDVDTADITYVSATLYNDIALNYKVAGATNYTDVYMQFTMGDETVKVTDYTVDGDFKVFTFRNLAPHRMIDEVTGTLYGTKDGKNAALATYTTSLATYCETIMPAEEEEDFELYALCRDILNYGAASQKYKSYKTNNLANKNLSAIDQTITAPTLYNCIDKEYKVISSPKAEWKSFGLYLDAAMDMRLGFESNDVISDLSVKVEKSDGTVETLKNCIYRQNGKYFFNFDNFNVCETKDIFYFTLMRGNTAVSNTVAYNVESYAYLAKQSSDSALKLVTNAMMNYVNSAIEYKAMQ